MATELALGDIAHGGSSRPATLSMCWGPAPPCTPRAPSAAAPRSRDEVRLAAAHAPLLVAAAIILVAAAAADARTSISKAPIRPARAGQGTLIGYRSVGHGRPLVLVMGLAGTMNAWEPSFVDALAAHHRVITFDNEGIGASTLAPGALSI